MRLTVKSAAAVAALAVGMPSLASAQQQQAQGSSEAQTALTAMAGNAANWVMPNGDYANTRYSELSQINKDNVKNLQVAWTFSTGVLRGHEGGPLVIGNMMYVHTPFPNIVYAIDLNDPGKRVVWKYEPKQDPNVIPVMCCDTVNRGVAYGDGKIFLHQADTTLVALDANTGKEVWTVKTDDPSKGATGTSAPVVYNGKVYVGVSGGEFGVRGWLAAYNTSDGKQAWRAYSMGPDRHAARPAEDDLARQAGRAGQRHEYLAGRPVEDRRRHHLGLDLRRSRAEPRLLRLGQPLDLEPDAAAR